MMLFSFQCSALDLAMNAFNSEAGILIERSPNLLAGNSPLSTLRRTVVSERPSCAAASVAVTYLVTYLPVRYEGNNAITNKCKR